MMRIHHIGYLTKNIMLAKEQFTKMGFVPETKIEYDSYRMLNILFMINDGYRVELLEPCGKESPLYSLLKRYKNTPYHFCYKTKNLKKASQTLIEQGYYILQEPQIAPCIEGKLVTFLMHSDIGIIELLEE